MGEHELHLAKVSTNFEMVQKDKHQVDNEFVMTKMKNEDLSETLQRALEQRDSARAEVFTLYAKIQELKVEKEEANEILEGLYTFLSCKIILDWFDLGTTFLIHSKIQAVG